MNKMRKIVSLCKRRGFVFPGSEIYGGLANTWDYGPLGVELVNNIKNLWWKRFVQDREDVVGISSAIFMNSKVWQVSGHVKTFGDEMFRTTNRGIYLRPETAQGMFVNYENIKNTARLKLPFGIAQIGKAFRNEITPKNFIFRVLEFEQMEIEYFCQEKDWQKYFEHWQNEMANWLKDINIKNYEIREHKKDELSHYSKKTIDFEYKFPFGQKELYGLAYRTDFDLKVHGFKNPAHVIEPSFGLERTVLAVLCEAYFEEDKRVILKLDKKLAPYKAAVFPLLANKPKLIKKARQVFEMLKTKFLVVWDDRGNIGKRYFSQDEIGTPSCITIDFQTLEDNTVTIRNRDTTKQERIKINEIATNIQQG